jgi:curved DNA-binding protein CbpA
MPTVQTYYEILGVAPDATPDEIRAAYRKLAKQYHPDVNSDPDAGERFIAVQQAYETLSDPEARARYDLALRGGMRPGSHDAFRHRASGGEGQTMWTRGYTWRAEAPRSGGGWFGFIAVLLVWAVAIIFMLLLSLLSRVTAGDRRE